MLRARVVLFACVLVVCLAVAAFSDQVVLSGVPSYLWYNGCGPTSVGMLMGYWDAHGYERLISGPNSWSTNQPAVKSMIASAGHNRDYVPTPDRVATAQDPYHPDDSVADFLHTSRDPESYGWGSSGWLDVGMRDYAQYKGYTGAVAENKVYSSESFWTAYVDQINRNRPANLIVDINGDGATDHLVIGIGYDVASHRYAAYNTYDSSVHWYNFTRLASGAVYGVYGGAFFDPGPLPGDANNDGRVDGADLAIWQQNYDPLGLNTNAWAKGDWNGDGRVDGGDLALWQLHYNPLASPLSTLAADAPVLSGGTLALSTVPEPNLSLLLTGIMGLSAAWPWLRRRKR